MGPFCVIKRIGDAAAKLALPKHLHIHPVFHVSLLKRVPNNEEFSHPTVTLRLPPVETDKGLEYEVEKILQKRVRNQTVYYLIKWKGYSDVENTWEPLSNLTNCKELILQFERRNSKSREEIYNGEGNHVMIHT